MIQRFRKVIDGLYRGSAPSPKDVMHLKNDFDIKKIISLDRDAGEKINRACKLMNINHVKLYLDEKKSSLNKLLNQNIKKLLIDDGPTFIHCHYGKDRTGLVVALFKCKYMHEDPEKAIQEAKSLGFGAGVDPKFTSLYEKLIRSCKPINDENSADIVSNEREYIGDNRDSFLDESRQHSFAPYLSKTRQNPADAVYNYINDQSPTRQNYHEYKSIKEHNDEEDDIIPQVGIYNNDAGIHGAGPAEPVGGFISD